MSLYRLFELKDINELLGIFNSIYFPGDFISSVFNKLDEKVLLTYIDRFPELYPIQSLDDKDYITLKIINNITKEIFLTIVKENINELREVLEIKIKDNIDILKIVLKELLYSGIDISEYLPSTKGKLKLLTALKNADLTYALLDELLIQNLKGINIKPKVIGIY